MKKWMLSMLGLTLAVATTGCAPDGNGGDGAASGESTGKTAFSISFRTGNISYADNHPNINEDKWVKKLEELTNTDLDIRLVPHKEFDQKMIQMFAIQDIPDVVQASSGLSNPQLSGSVQAGVFLPLNELLEKHGQNLLKKIPKEAWEKETDAKGNIYAIPEWLSNPSRRATWIRADLLEKTGLPEPKTVEDYLNVMRAFKKLGITHPYMGRQDFVYSDVFFGAYDVFGNFFMKQGDQIVPKFFNVEGMQQAIQTYKTMVDEGLMSKEFATIDPTNFKNEILAGRAGIWNMNANLLIQWDQQLKNIVPEGRMKLIPSPVGPDGQGGLRLVGNVTRAYFINKKAKDPAGIVKFFDWMVSDEAEKFFTFGIEGENYTMSNGAIQYKKPVTSQEVDEETFRQTLLWLVQDTTYNKGVLSQTPEGRELMKLYDTVLASEGRDGIQFDPPLQGYAKNPDIAPTGDKLPPVILTHVLKMVYGKEPITDYPKVLEEWLSKGGKDVVKEATERYNKQDGVTLSRHKN
ncbi:putative aldouronate transport system substrate-binding protein [Paenibacillus sp. UNCCL117]|uniref:extracellular solute-binding protein n=1 Tax=unclassified Paenibacillus TaxID=185978 RepID=UPI00087F2D3A|nr:MULTISPECIES: extracellular solute-binding protein [unclassified Paenibacillus]SDD38232.1 putative aldouronate transport system substrate-binding protein [Paenibacillus sp. cl123]SFW48622.1 putative aldouronate transport system substrate-binding protein [Paenibacillus sp. UNCCL117]